MNTQRIVVLLSIVSMLGCTTMQPLKPNQASLGEELTPGSNLAIHMYSGQVFEMTLESFDGEVLRGRTTGEPSTPLEVRLEDVQSLEIRKVDGVGTLKVVGGVLLLVLISALLVAGSGGGSSADFNWTGGGSN